MTVTRKSVPDVVIQGLLLTWRRNSLSDRKFRIECDLDWDDTLSYQDSFKWYNESKGTADNYGSGDIALDITDGSLNGEEEYDDFHEYNCRETTTVYYHGQEYYCDVENLGEFTWIEQLEEYHHDSDVLSCSECEEDFLKEDKYYSEITEEDYCCEECRKKAEQTYKRKTGIIPIMMRNTMRMQKT